jgi:HPt (histidine-containing phosphotransfer) domain-containing protein
MSDDSPFQNSKAESPPRSDSEQSANPTGSQDSQTTEAKQKKLQSLLAGLWERSRQTITERIETLQQARFLAAANELDEPARLRAVDSAHKLAGVLGTFGLPHGTELAREAEEVFGGRTIIAPADLERLAALLDDLASLVQTAGAYPGVDPR